MPQHWLIQERRADRPQRLDGEVVREGVGERVVVRRVDVVAAERDGRRLGDAARGVPPAVGHEERVARADGHRRPRRELEEGELLGDVRVADVDRAPVAREARLCVDVEVAHVVGREERELLGALDLQRVPTIR